MIIIIKLPTFYFYSSFNSITLNITVMKTLNKNLFLLLITVFFVFQHGIAQNYKHPLNINSQGHVLDERGVKLGWIEEDGSIKNKDGVVVGKIQKTAGEAIFLNKSGKKIGTLSKNGTLKEINGKVLYTISTADESGVCKILDASNREIGTVHENYKQQGACAMHCLKGDKLAKKERK